MAKSNPLTQAYPWINPSNAPLANAPMLNIATAPLAISVSAAGGIGFIAGGYDTSGLESQLEEATKLVQKLSPSNPARTFFSQTGTLPLGVGFLNWGADGEAAVRILRNYPVAAAWLFAPREMPGDLVSWASDIRGISDTSAGGSKKWNVQLWIQIGTVHEAASALSTLTPDILVVQGSDAGGHGLAHSASIITLLPEVHALLQSMNPPVMEKGIYHSESIPQPTVGKPHLLAAGGITTGRTLLASLTLGACGAVMGTRFLASTEAKISKGYRAEVLRASDGGVSTVRSTVYDRVRGIYGWPERYNGRGVINRSYLDAVEGMDDEENRRLYGVEMGKGDEGWGPAGRMTTYAGTGVGLVKEVLSAGEILEEVWGEVRVVSGELGLE